MAEEQEDIYQDPAFTGTNVKKERTQSDNEPVDPSPDVKQEYSDDASSSSTPANEAPTNDCDADLAKVDHLQITVINDPSEGESDGGCKGDSAKDEKTIPEMDSCPAGEDPTTNKIDSEAAALQIPAKEQEEGVDEAKAEIIVKSPAAKDANKEPEEGEDPTTSKIDPDAAALQIPAKGEEEGVDGAKAEIIVKSPAAKDTNKEAEEDGLKASEEEINKQKNSVLPQKRKAPDVKESDVKESDVKENNVETIGPSTIQGSDSAVTERGNINLWIAVVVVVIAVLMYYHLQPESPSPTTDLCHINTFLKKMDEVKTQYPNQRSELWKRSRIHLKRHLQTSQPTEPVSLVLTAGLRAERTLRCLAQSLASAFSSALNASVLHIDGASKARLDSDRVKLDIDSELQGAFEGDKPVAVIHRFEELPPGSTLIFYRYCDHENAAYKKTFLLFTVLLAEEEEIPTETRLSVVEEMVDDHLQKKFLSHGPPASFDQMDLNKYGGLWSRISHLILPVAAETSKELEGC